MNRCLMNRFLPARHLVLCVDRQDPHHGCKPWGGCRKAGRDRPWWGGVCRTVLSWEASQGL